MNYFLVSKMQMIKTRKTFKNLQCWTFILGVSHLSQCSALQCGPVPCLEPAKAPHPHVTQFSFMASHYFPTQTLVLSTMTLSQYLSFLGLPFIYRVSINLLVHLSTCQICLSSTYSVAFAFHLDMIKKCACVCVLLCLICTSVWRSEVKLWCCSLGTVYLVLLTKDIFLDWNSKISPENQFL